MNDVSIKRKYISTLIVCMILVMIVGSHSCNKGEKWTDIGAVVVNEISVNGTLKFDQNCDGKTDMTLTCKNIKLMPANYPDPDKHPSYAIGRYREKCAKFFINSKNEIIKWEAYPDLKVCCPEPISKCDMCPLDTSSWAGLSHTYNGSSLPYPADINVSSTPVNKSRTSTSMRDIAVDATGRVHAVWIETDKNVRNVYYACSKPYGIWAKTNVSQFPTEGKKFQARNAAIAVTSRGVPHITWEVEIDNNNTPLTLEENDNHYVYYVYGSGGCPQSSWKTCGGNDYSPPSPSHTPGPGSYNNANVSRNDFNSSHADAWNPAIALDDKGRPHITWHNETPYHTIFWVYCDHEAWKTCDGAVYHFESNSNCNAIVSQSNSSHYVAPSIAIDSGNNVHIAYHLYPSSTGGIYYVSINSAPPGYVCQQQPIVISDAGIWSSIDVDSNDKPWIVWEDGAIKYSSGPSWSGPGIIPGNQDCHAPCLALDRDNKPHIVYYCNSNNNQEIFYSYNLSSPINVSNNSDNSFSPSLALDNNCNPHLLWTDETPEDEREVLYVHLQCKLNCDMCPLDTSSWAGLSSTYDGSSPPYPDDINVSYTSGNKSRTSTSMRDIAVVDNTGRVHVVWIETENDVRDVYYACSLTTGSWEKTNVSRFPQSKKFQARNAAIAVTSRGIPHITWEVEIDNNNTPLTLEENDNHYVYYVYGSSDCQQTIWKTCSGTIYSPPSSTPGPNRYNDANVSRNDSHGHHSDAWNPAIALDNNHRPHITWHNETPYHTIFWVYCYDESWKTCGGQDYQFQASSTCNAIVSQSNSSHYMAPSIAIDSQNEVHIAYHSYPSSTSSIYYVHIISGSSGYVCQQQPIVISDTGIRSSIAVDSNDHPWIVWEDDVIKYKYFSGVSWSGPVTISGNQDCHAPCLALDRDDKPHIVYYCNSNNNQEIFYSYNWSISNPPVNVSNNSGNSFSPSIALDNNCNPHLLWTDETPAAEREVLYVHLQCCKWTNCGIIKSRETNGMNSVKIEFYDCETGNTITIYGDPNLFAINADDIDWSPSNSGTIAKYEKGLCAKYCLLENEDGSLQIDKWEAVPPDDPCCCN